MLPLTIKTNVFPKIFKSHYHYFSATTATVKVTGSVKRFQNRFTCTICHRTTMSRVQLVHEEVQTFLDSNCSNSEADLRSIDIHTRVMGNCISSVYGMFPSKPARYHCSTMVHLRIFALVSLVIFRHCIPDRVQKSVPSRYEARVAERSCALPEFVGHATKPRSGVKQCRVTATGILCLAFADKKTAKSREKNPNETEVIL